jgi:predicted nucleic acid-binding protein
MLIALDSNIFIAALSENEEYSLIAQHLVRDIAAGKHRAITSSIAYGEVLSVSNNSELDLESFFSNIVHLSTISADDDICLQAGQLRLEYGKKLKFPDAINVATALFAHADRFITNNKPLVKIAQNLLPTTALEEWR